MLVPFFLVFKLELYHDLQFSAFAQMYTYVLYCPDVFKLNWLLMKITRNLSSSYQIEVQQMECLLLLHSSMIIDWEELSKFEEDLDLINVSQMLILFVDAFTWRKNTQSASFMKLSSTRSTTCLVIWWAFFWIVCWLKLLTRHILLSPFVICIKNCQRKRVDFINQCRCECGFCSICQRSRLGK